MIYANTSTEIQDSQEEEEYDYFNEEPLTDEESLEYEEEENDYCD
ncbi:hypothetical protein N9X61_03875 [Sulfurimonas sp.]|nr:hypothetical protein [Sulfurimonas sp.]